MDQISNEYYIENILIRGYIRYKDNTPVKNAIVILEKISCKENIDLQEEQNQSIYLNHMVTGNNGEYCFLITDRTSNYKIKVFDNHHR